MGVHGRANERPGDPGSGPQYDTKLGQYLIKDDAWVCHELTCW